MRFWGFGSTGRISAQDVGANKAALIAARGFSEAAKTRSRNAGLDLYRLVDARAHEWRSYVSIPVVVDDRSLGSFSLTFSGTGEIRIAPQDFRETVLFRADQSQIGAVKKLLAKLWDEGRIQHQPGEQRDIALTQEETYILTDGRLYRVDVLANVHVIQTLYFGQLPLKEVQGFSDELQGGLITNGFTTDELNFAKVEDFWYRVESPESLAVQPVLTLHVSSSYPV